MKHPIPQRRTIRLRDYDYRSEGLYFVTICTQDRRALFDEIVDVKMNLTAEGRIVDEEWQQMFRFLEGYATWIVMPNHIHGLIAIGNSAEPTKPLGRQIGAFKSITTNLINQLHATRGVGMWQRNFYEHVIRDERSLASILAYITDNPARWRQDPENPNCT